MLQKKRHDLRQNSYGYNKGLFSILFTLKYEARNHMRDQDIINNISGLLHGGYDTTNLAMMFKILSTHKACFEEITKEQLKIMSRKGEGDEITWEDT
eukprot:Gb_37028 [translate_table: standard]